MVLTRAGKMDSEKGSKIKVKIPNRNGGKYSGEWLIFISLKILVYNKGVD